MSKAGRRLFHLFHCSGTVSESSKTGDKYTYFNFVSSSQSTSITILILEKSTILRDLEQKTGFLSVVRHNHSNKKPLPIVVRFVKPEKLILSKDGQSDRHPLFET